MSPRCNAPAGYGGVVPPYHAPVLRLAIAPPYHAPVLRLAIALFAIQTGFHGFDPGRRKVFGVPLDVPA